MEQLQSLYARGAVLLALLASVVVSGLLAFWQDFFSIWTRGAIPYDQSLTVTLLIGTVVAAPSILAVSYANYSDRGKPLASAKGLQLLVFLALCLLLIPWFGALGAALAIVSCDVFVQLGWLTTGILRQTLKRPLEHALFLMALIAAVTLSGWSLGMVIHWATPGTGLKRLVAESALWLLVVALVASPLRDGKIRSKLAAIIPR